MANGQGLIDFYKSFGGTQRISPIERENLIVEEKQNELMPMTPPVVPLLASDLSTMGPPEPTGLLTEKEQEDIAKDPVALAKFSRAGNLFASFGGFQEPTQQELAQATPEKLNFYNQEKIAARNRGIGEMLLMLSDALGGRDVAMRALERQQARQPAKEELTAAQRNYQTYLEITKTGTPEEIQLAGIALLGIRQNKPKSQIKNELVASLSKQTNPNTLQIYTEDEIEKQLKIIDRFYQAPETETQQENSFEFKVPGYTITEG